MYSNCNLKKFLNIFKKSQQPRGQGEFRNIKENILKTLTRRKATFLILPAQGSIQSSFSLKAQVAERFRLNYGEQTGQVTRTGQNWSRDGSCPELGVHTSVARSRPWAAGSCQPCSPTRGRPAPPPPPPRHRDHRLLAQRCVLPQPEGPTFRRAPLPLCKHPQLGSEERQRSRAPLTRGNTSPSLKGRPCRTQNSDLRTAHLTTTSNEFQMRDIAWYNSQPCSHGVQGITANRGEELPVPQTVAPCDVWGLLNRITHSDLASPVCQLWSSLSILVYIHIHICIHTNIYIHIHTHSIYFPYICRGLVTGSKRKKTRITKSVIK